MREPKKKGDHQGQIAQANEDQLGTAERELEEERASAAQRMSELEKRLDDFGQKFNVLYQAGIIDDHGQLIARRIASEVLPNQQ